MTDDQHLHNRLVQLAEELLKRTTEGKLSWSVTDNEQKFIFSATSTSVTVESTPLPSEQERHTKMGILNNRGTVVETLNTEWGDEYKHDPWDEASAAPWNAILDNLYFAARRNALNVDRVLDGLFADLNDTESNPEADGFSDEPPF